MSHITGGGTADNECGTGGSGNVTAIGKVGTKQLPLIRNTAGVGNTNGELRRSTRRNRGRYRLIGNYRRTGSRSGFEIKAVHEERLSAGGAIGIEQETAGADRYCSGRRSDGG